MWRRKGGRRVTRFWLTPVSTLRPPTLGGERIRCEPGEAWSALLQLVERTRPRLLVPFKARLLAGEDGDGTCGGAPAPFDLTVSGDIVFDGDRLRLSDCGRAMLDKLPDLRACGMAADAIAASLSPDVPSETASWIGSMRRWFETGWHVILLKEEP